MPRNNNQPRPRPANIDLSNIEAAASPLVNMGRIQAAAARMLVVLAVADACDETESFPGLAEETDPGAGGDWFDTVPEKDCPEANKAAEKLVGEVDGLEAYAARWIQTTGRDETRFGEVLVYVALGHGVGFEDDMTNGKYIETLEVDSSTHYSWGPHEFDVYAFCGVEKPETEETEPTPMTGTCGMRGEGTV